MPRGTGPCDPRAEGVTRDSCGGPTRGRCTQGKVCECKEGWTGPNCLVSDGFDPIAWDEPDKISDVGFIPPEFAPNGLLFGLTLVGIVFLIAMQWKNRMEGWTPIPDVDSKLLR